MKKRYRINPCLSVETHESSLYMMILIQYMKKFEENS